MYGRLFLFLLISLISCSFANTCKDDSECPSFHSVRHNMTVDQWCKNNSCKPYIRGRTCDRCETLALSGKCCDKNIVPGAWGSCNCKEPQCTKKADCWFGNPRRRSFYNLAGVLAKEDISTFDNSTANDKFYDCINGVCAKPKQPKCGRCSEKAINGRCCNGKLHDDGYCWCRCEGGSRCPSGTYCNGSWCVPEVFGKTCGKCDKEPINGRCCGAAVIDRAGGTGLCYCKSDKQCTSWNHCSGNSVCCSNNHCYPNVLMPCPSGTYEL